MKFDEGISGNHVCYGGSEYPFYSDVDITGEIIEGLGPYTLLNALPMRSRNTAEIVIILRSFIFEDFNYSFRVAGELKTNVARYHGGNLAEEIAALTSLALGIRLKAGDANRYFDGSDPHGRFQAMQWRPLPSLSVSLGRPKIPMPTSVNLNEAQPLLSTVPKVKPELYVELVRAARAYQDALWMAEAEPHLAWLLFVSAIEIAANARFASSGSPSENLRELKGGLAQLLLNTGGEDLLEKVAADLKDLFGSTKKFLLFCEEFMPAEPPIRPSADWGRIEWKWVSLKKILSKVYALRSKALHAGIPFPLPMCREPDQYGDDGPAERAITSMAVHTMNGSWVPEDAPISLHTFHYFVRGALLNWWGHISE
ncbi:hypothetical protein GHO29_05520 [Pseudomonas helleri]|uniref:Apea-like HEPN domain-containing protein n=1 Tax=Pseudomonas helleri TaxID=1608996 RepID=A0A7X2CCM1_9PSED|nr:hypothetical protein [Pseudomonas helleri]MQU25941.1 hypothetical protein [Pseudomonas helleri]